MTPGVCQGVSVCVWPLVSEVPVGGVLLLQWSCTCRSTACNTLIITTGRLHEAYAVLLGCIRQWSVYKYSARQELATGH